MADEGPKELKVPLEVSPHYARFRATIMWGSVNADELEFSLIEDTVSPPSVFTLEQVAPNAYRDSTVQQASGLKRIQHATVTMPVSVLPGVIQWLQDKYAEAMQLRERAKGAERQQ